MSNYPANDDNYEDAVIDDLEVDEAGRVVAFGCDGLWLGWRKTTPLVPKIGDTVREYYCGNGKFTGVRGVFLNGECAWYETHSQWRARIDREQAARDQARRDEFERKGRGALDAKYDALPSVLQQRIVRLRQEDPDFRWRDEGYEMFCCEEAVKIAHALQTPEAVKAFTVLPYAVQQRCVPTLSDGHSGNTFGAACSLAHYLLTQREAA